MSESVATLIGGPKDGVVIRDDGRYEIAIPIISEQDRRIDWGGGVFPSTVPYDKLAIYRRRRRVRDIDPTIFDFVRCQPGEV